MLLHQTFPSRTVHLFALLSCVLLCVASPARAQETQYDRGTPPQHTAGVSQIGSYLSTDLGTVNLSNGALNFKIPMGSVGGRGFRLPLTLNYSSKVWSASNDTDEMRDGRPAQVFFADYSVGDDEVDIFSHIGAGWTVGAAPMLSANVVRINRIASGPNVGCYTRTLTKLKLVLPDKGEVEFRDDVYDGSPLPSDCSGYNSTYSRGLRWHATDGSGTIYISDQPLGGQFPQLSGVVITSEGTRYRFNAAACASITDRHGNKITITYVNNPPANLEVVYTDQLGRVTRVQENVTDPQTGAPLALLVTLPGYAGQNRYFKIKSALMNQNYRSGISPSLPVITGDYDPLSYNYRWPGTPTRLFSLSYGLYAQRIDNRRVLTELVLPDNRSLKFAYNQFGEVAEMQMPTGGRVQYDYAWRNSLPSGNTPAWQASGGGATGTIRSSAREVDRALVERRTYPDGATLEGRWSYTYGAQFLNGVSRSCTRVSATSAAGAVLLDQRHFFLADGQYTDYIGGAGAHDGTYYTLWSTGVEWRSDALDANGNVISASEQDWTQRVSVSWVTGYAQEQPANDNRVNEAREILDDGKAARVTTLYDQYNNPTEVYEYDFDSSVTRRTVTSYPATNAVNGINYADDSLRLIRLPLQQSIYDGAGAEQARTVYEYDKYGVDGNNSPLQSYSLVTGHDSANYGTARTARGNATGVGLWFKDSNRYLYSYTRYDILGNVVSAKDPNGNVSTVNYQDDFGDGSNPGGGAGGANGPTYALPTLATSPPPASGAQPHTARSQYDFSTGLLTGFRDRNNVVTQTIYNDPFDRPTLVKSALGVTGVENHAAMYYAPATAYGSTLTNNDVLTATDQNIVDDAMLRSWARTDGFGRTTESWTRDPQGDTQVVTLYDALGRQSKVSNPLRPSQGEMPRYTTTDYDMAGRVRAVTTPDNAAVNTSYTGNQVTVTDQAGKSRRSVNDALGRLTQVVEDPNGAGYVTSYTYDALNNLRQVTQDSQRRFFMYDSLSRLIRAKNPEQGAINTGDPAFPALTDAVTGNNQWSLAYVYDDNGNLKLRMDARGVKTTYTYDALNRNRTVRYADGSPAVDRDYDGAVGGKGRFWRNYVWGDGNNEHFVVESYDTLGRPLSQRQQSYANNTWHQAYYVQRTYDLAGHVKTQTYPSGRTVNYAYDAAGRTGSFTGNLGDGLARTYAAGLQYTAAQQLKQEQFGTDTALYNKRFYNVRQQLSEIRVGVTANDTGWNRGAIINHYSDQSWAGSGTDNNGNLKKQDIYVPNDEQTTGYSQTTQFYDYDALNRLDKAREERGGGIQWVQDYTYDRFGNRRINQAGSSGNVQTTQFDLEEMTNRLYAPGDLTRNDEARGLRYDAAGNLIKDSYTGQGRRTYDAEQRMTTAQDIYSQTSRYTYNADGQRVRRNIAGQEVWQVYGMDGELLAEYAAGGAPGSPQKEYGYRNGELLVTATAATRTNVALAQHGATASASSAYPGFAASGVTNGDRKGLGVWHDGYWSTAVPGFPAWLEIDFAGTKTIDEVHVFTTQDNYASPIEPTVTATFSLYGLHDYEVQYWTGSAWATITGARVSGNNLLWRRFTFAPLTTSKLRVQTAASADGYSRLAEVEAYSTGSSAQVQWIVADQLGTPRMVIDRAGTLSAVKRHDYLPFGEEVGAGVGGHTQSQGYSQFDGNRKKWAQLERDGETGLDYAQARYYSATMGRFTSPDEFTDGPDELYRFVEDAADNPTVYADLENPQSLNKYQYTYNNPLNMVDPDGHCPDCPGLIIVPPTLVVKIIENPGKALDVVQTIISGVGIIPGAGEVADGVNAAVSTARGNYGEATLDAAGALGPIASSVAVGNRIRKILGKADDVADAVDTARKIEKRNIEVVHSTRKRALEAAEHPHPGKKMPMPPKSDTKKRTLYKEQQKYKKPERHPDSKHKRPHFHDRNKTKNKVNRHHTYPE